MENLISLENGGIKNLSKFEKVIVTGPPRSGTTISGKIIAHELGYEFIDEHQYEHNISVKFVEILLTRSSVVVHTTSFTRDIHLIKNIPIVLVKRNINDILKSFENSKRFKGKHENGLFARFDDEALGIILNHYGCKNGCVPEVIYDHFYKHNKDFFELNYEDLKDHELFIDKDKRKKFTHLKQTKETEK